MSGSAFGSIRYLMLGRSKLATNCLAAPRFSRDTISALVAFVAVAVSAILGTLGHLSCRADSAR